MTPDLVARLNLHRAGRSWRGRCPACGYAEAFTLDVRAGRILGWCASCQDQTAIGRMLGGAGERRGLAAPAAMQPGRTPEREQAKRNAALRLWEGGIPVFATPAQRYLASRGLPDLWKSGVLRFRADAAHPAGGRYPALLAMVQDAAGSPLAVHRTYLTATGQKASVDPVKASKGPVWGGAVRVDPEAPEIVLAEGIESAGAAGRILSLPAWAAISAGNLATGLILPDTVRAVVIAADCDDAGTKAAATAAERWQAEGRRVRIARPAKRGQDFNDILRARMEAADAT
jgi:hypothetical protein